MIWIILLMSLVAFWVLVASRHPKDFPPGPRMTFPLLGNALDIGTDVAKGMKNLTEKYGKVFGLYLGKLRTVVVSDYDLIQEVGNSPVFTNRQYLYGIADLRGGMVRKGEESSIGGIITSNGGIWQEQRRFALHALKDLGFGKRSMEQLIQEEVLELCSTLEKTLGQPIDVRHYFQLAVVNSLWIVTAGERMDHKDPNMKRLVHLMDKTVQQFGTVSVALAMLYKPVYLVAKHTYIKNISSTIKELEGLMEDMISEHRETFQQDNLRDFTDYYLKESSERSKSLEESSFKGKDGHTNLINNLLDLFFAGSETTSTTLNWCMLFLIKYPEVQDKLHEEIDRVSGRARMLKMEDKVDTPYVEAFIHEVQRCGDIAPLALIHENTEDAYLCGYFIPKGTSVVPHIGHVLSDPASFPNPERFDPSRYISTKGTFQHHPHVIPFGLGKRRCLGESLARMSLYLFLTGVLSQFNIEKSHANDHVTSSPMCGGAQSPYPYKVKFTPRH